MSLDQVRDLCREAGHHHQDGRVRAGLLLAEEAVATCVNTLGRNHYAYALSLCTLGWLRHGLDEGATSVFAEAVARARALEEADFEHALVVLTHAADFAIATGRQQRAADLSNEVVELHRRHLGSDHPRTFRTAFRWQQKLVTSQGSADGIP